MIKNTTLYEFGYNFLGPICAEYFHNVSSYADENSTDFIGFLAREGYLFKKIFAELCTRNLIKNRKSAYVYASRTFLFRISIGDTDSWDLSLKNKFEGSLQKLLLARFGFTLSQIEKVFEAEELNKNWILPQDKTKLQKVFEKHQSELGGVVEDTKLAYLSYLDSIGLTDSKVPLVLDVGYNGTIQKLLSKLLQKSTQGLYFITHNQGITKADRYSAEIKSVFKDGVHMGGGYTMLDRSLFLECLLTSPEGQFVDIHNKMKSDIFEFSFGKKAYTQRNFQELDVVFSGAIDCVIFSFINAIRYSSEEIEMLYEQFSKKRNLLPKRTWALFDVDDAISGNNNVDPLSLFGL